MGDPKLANPLWRGPEGESSTSGRFCRDTTHQLCQALSRQKSGCGCPEGWDGRGKAPGASGRSSVSACYPHTPSPSTREAPAPKLLCLFLLSQTLRPFSPTGKDQEDALAHLDEMLLLWFPHVLCHCITARNDWVHFTWILGPVFFSPIESGYYIIPYPGQSYYRA